MIIEAVILTEATRHPLLYQLAAGHRGTAKDRVVAQSDKLYQLLYILHILAMKALLTIYRTTEYSALGVTHKDHQVQLLRGWSAHPGSNPQHWCY